MIFTAYIIETLIKRTVVSTHHIELLLFLQHHRKVAYAALKEGVECVQEDNERLEEDLLTRFDSMFITHTHTAILRFLLFVFSLFLCSAFVCFPLHNVFCLFHYTVQSVLMSLIIES
jgi:hypothetical protein